MLALHPPADLLLSLTALHLTGMGPHVSGIIAAGGSERVIGCGPGIF